MTSIFTTGRRIAVVAAAVLLVGLAVDAAAKPTSGTAVRPDDRATHGPGAIAQPASDAVLRPDDRAAHGIGAVALSAAVDPIRPDDRATHGPGAALSEPIVMVGSASGDSFDWTDAAVGAAGALGLVVLLGGLSIAALRRKQGPAFS